MKKTFLDRVFSFLIDNLIYSFLSSLMLPLLQVPKIPIDSFSISGQNFIVLAQFSFIGAIVYFLIF